MYLSVSQHMDYWCFKTNVFGILAETSLNLFDEVQYNSHHNLCLCFIKIIYKMTLCQWNNLLNPNQKQY